MRAIIGWPLLLVGAYFIGALVGSFIPSNSDWREPDRGIPIFVETNGVHVSLIVPMRVSEDDEREGLDLASHGERAWELD